MCEPVLINKRSLLVEQAVRGASLLFKGMGRDEEEGIELSCRTWRECTAAL